MSPDIRRDLCLFIYLFIYLKILLTGETDLVHLLQIKRRIENVFIGRPSTCIDEDNKTTDFRPRHLLHKHFVVQTASKTSLLHLFFIHTFNTCSQDKPFFRLKQRACLSVWYLCIHPLLLPSEIVSLQNLSVA